tara:strand:+ start:397 stop:504 length:108 start_codon:yes stop_codon:yes gene_type:complete
LKGEIVDQSEGRDDVGIIQQMINKLYNKEQEGQSK